jgi:hypothetical protein
VQSLNTARQAFPKLHVVYFVTTDSVDAIIEDFAKPIKETSSQPQAAESSVEVSKRPIPELLYKYYAVHIYFVSGLNSTIVEKLKECEPLKRRILTIVDANLDFVGLN